MADEIEELIENKIEYEMTFIYDIDPNIRRRFYYRYVYRKT